MKIRLLSDLHCEFKLPYKTQSFCEYGGEDVLVLAGDIHSGSTNVHQVLKHFASIFPHVVYVAGNHEYYGSSFDHFNSSLQDKCAQLKNVHFLHRDTVNIDGVWFIGATLWSNFNKNAHSELMAQRRIADFRLIDNWKVQDCAEQYYLDREYIKTMYGGLVGKKVIVTHFLPAQECIAPEYRQNGSDLNDYFANRLDDYIWSLEDTTWLFGHTHTPADFYIGNTRVVANPHGYYGSGEGADFDPHKCIVL